jgi:two-component system chemotaxis response regulator CheB
MENGRKISVLIVDDSATYRQFLREAFSVDDRIEVVSIASNGRLALPRVRHYRPDFIILDHEMPEMTGIEALREIRQIHPDSRVIMFSSHTTEGARVTIEALKEGAVDFVTKPDSGGKETPVEYIRRKLLSRIIELADSMNTEAAAPQKSVPEPIHTGELPDRALPGAFDVAAIGISTGGPVALRKLFQKFERPLRGALLIVQHMPPVFTRQLAESLRAESVIPTFEAFDGMKIQSGMACIAPGGFHLAVERKADGVYAKILDTEPENSCKPSADVLFRHVAEVYRSRAVGIIMTGMGHDGYRGMLEMKKAGCYLIAQSRESCLVYGMPSRPTEEGIVQESLDIDGIARRIRYLLGD